MNDNNFTVNYFFQLIEINLILFQVACFNRTVSKVDDFIKNEAKGTKIIGAHSIEELVQLLKKPRRVMLLVQAGKAVDEFIGKLVKKFISIFFY